MDQGALCICMCIERNGLTYNISTYRSAERERERERERHNALRRIALAEIKPWKSARVACGVCLSLCHPDITGRVGHFPRITSCSLDTTTRFGHERVVSEHQSKKSISSSNDRMCGYFADVLGEINGPKYRIMSRVNLQLEWMKNCFNSLLI